MVSTWSIGGKTVQSLVINNKEVQSIVRNSDGKVLYEKASAHNYSISFGQSSYTATGGACTISCTLLDNGSPVSGATVTVTGSDSSLYTSITNSLGVAVFNVTYANSGNINYTANYMDTTANCIVTYSTTYTGPLSQDLESIIITGDDDYTYEDLYDMYIADSTYIFGGDDVTAPMLNNLSAEDFPQGAAYPLGELMGLTTLPYEFSNEDITYIQDETMIYIPLFLIIGGNDPVEFTVTATDSTHLIITLQ